MTLHPFLPNPTPHFGQPPICSLHLLTCLLGVFFRLHIEKSYSISLFCQIYFTEHNDLKVQLHCHEWQELILFLRLIYIYIPKLFTHSPINGHLSSFMPIPYCFNYYSLQYSLKLGSRMPSSFVLLKISLTIQGFMCMVPCIF